MDEQQPWHRLFGMSWTDFFLGLPVVVNMEKDLSLKQQYLDVVLIRKQAEPIDKRLPDGFEDLAAHNLISFKSYQEALDGWTLNELVGHYVNYRKQASPSMKDLLPETDFRVFAVCVRFPQGLAQQVKLERLREGVYEAAHFSGKMRIVVVHQLPLRENNAMLHLFSARMDLVQYGVSHYAPHSKETSSLLLQLFRRYRQEELLMPDVMQQFVNETVELLMSEMPPEQLKKYLTRLSAEDRLEGLSDEQRLKGLPPEKRLEGLSDEQRLKGLPPEKRLEGLSDEQRLKGLPPEKRLEGLSDEQRLKGLPPEKRLEGLTDEQRLKGLPPEKRLEGLTDEQRLKGLPPEKRLEGLTDEQRLKGLPPEKRLEGLTDEQRLKGLPPEKRLEGLTDEQRLKGLPPEKRLEGLTDAEIQEALARRKKANGPSE